MLKSSPCASGTYCSHTSPNDVVSDGGTLHIGFSSNDKVVGTGFAAIWKAVDPAQGEPENNKPHTTSRILSFLNCLFFLLSPLAQLQLPVGGVSALTWVKSPLQTGLRTTKLRLCAHGVSAFLHQKVFMLSSLTLSYKLRCWENVWTTWRFLMEKTCHYLVS